MNFSVYNWDSQLYKKISDQSNVYQWDIAENQYLV